MIDLCTYRIRIGWFNLKKRASKPVKTRKPSKDCNKYGSYLWCLLFYTGFISILLSWDFYYCNLSDGNLKGNLRMEIKPSLALTPNIKGSTGRGSTKYEGLYH